MMVQTQVFKKIFRGIWRHSWFMSIGDLVDGGRDARSRPPH